MSTSSSRPSSRRLQSLPPRSVNSIVPSGANATSQGMELPETSGRTVISGMDWAAAIGTVEIHSAVLSKYLVLRRSV